MKLIIYQALVRLWGKGRMSSWDKASFDYLKTLGVDYIWYTGIPQHAEGEDFVKGDPGCPYAISDWKDVNPYLADKPEARMKEFRNLVLRTHKNGLKCLIDFIPNHVARNYRGPIVHHDWCDGDWTDTLKNDYSSRQTVDAMVDILDFWASLGVDGFRCDMVELVPAEAMTEIIKRIREKHPGLIFIAEAYNLGNYWRYLNEVGFDYLYDKSGIYDKLRAITCKGVSASELTRHWQWLGEMQSRMLNFLENHDEQRLASPWFAGSAEKGFAALAYALLFNDASFMLYFGQEAGEEATEGHEGRTSIFNWCRPRAVEDVWRFVHRGRLSEGRAEVFKRYLALMRFASSPLGRRGRTWDLCYCQNAGDGFNTDRHSAFLRYDDEGEWMLVFCNFSDCSARCSINVPADVLGQGFCVSVEAAPHDAVISLCSTSASRPRDTP